MRKLLFLFTIFYSLSVNAQNIKIYGTVNNSLNNNPIPFANIIIDGTNISTISDINGYFEIKDISPGQYNFKCSYIGFKTNIQSEIQISPNKNLRIDFKLIQNSTQLKEIKVKSNSFNKPAESPTSLRTINTAEIYRSPGGNRDISKVIANLPGVSTSPSFRNDIIIRGGAPNENRFFLDGIEIPNINHFATQGSSGGPVGILNVNFIREVDFYSGAFPANRGNALSSIMDLKQIIGSDEDFSASFMVGSSDAGLTINTPLSRTSSMLLSVRRSYLQFLFQALKLPFLPTYNDMQFKYTLKPNNKNQINIIALAAIDEFSLNLAVNDDEQDLSVIAKNEYLINNLPINEQWNYTMGSTWRHFFENSNFFAVISRSHLNNTSEKYLNNIEIDSNRLLDYKSQEIENKSRLEYNYQTRSLKINLGFSLDDVTYTNSTFNRLSIGDSLYTKSLNANLNFMRYAGFIQMSKNYLNDKLITSIGFRVDGDNFLKESGYNFSPRLSTSYILNEKSSLNSNIGSYYQLPAYTILGFKINNEFVNQDVKYIRCDHAIFGYEYNPSNYSKITIESFYKNYSNYPFSILDSLSLANLGGDFGVIGNEDVSSISSGKSYGIELLAQQKLSSSIYGIVSATYYKSLFEDKNGDLIPSAWDNQFILNITAGKKFKKNLEMGVKFRYSGGAPYTPLDLATSSIKEVWNINQFGIRDYSNLNAERLPNIHGLDVRIDKKWFFKKWSLNVYVDIQNIYNFKIELPSDVSIDSNVGDQVYESQNASQYNLYQIKNESGTLLPSIGFLIEF